MIQPNSFLVLAANRAAFATAYGPTNLVWDTFPGSLPASGELLTLLQPGLTPDSNVIVAQVLYANTPPWPAAASAGSALQLIDARQDNWRVGNWTAVQTNTTAAPHWVYVSTSIPATSSTFLLYLESAGDIYLDDIQLLDINGVNHLVDGGFESPLDGVWNLTTNGDGGSEFPGQPAGSVTHTNSKSLTVGYTATLSGSFINDFRFGYISEDLGDVGQQTQQYVNFRGPTI